MLPMVYFPHLSTQVSSGHERRVGQEKILRKCVWMKEGEGAKEEGEGGGREEEE